MTRMSLTIWIYLRYDEDVTNSMIYLRYDEDVTNNTDLPEV